MLPSQGLWLPCQPLDLLFRVSHKPPIPHLLVLHHEVPQEAVEAGPGWGCLWWELPCRAVPASRARPRFWRVHWHLAAPHWHPGQAQLLAQGEVFQLQGVDFLLQGLQQLLPGHLGGVGGYRAGSGGPCRGQRSSQGFPVCNTLLAKGLVVTLRARLA